MPNLPTYESKRNISTNVYSVNIGAPVLKDEASQAYDAPLKAIDTAFDLTSKWMQAQDTMQYVSYKANIGEAEIAQLGVAEADTNINNAPARIAEFQRVQDNALKGINSKSLQQKVALEGKLELQMFASKVDAIYKKKQIHVANADAMRLIEIQKSNYINSPDEEGKIEASTQIAKVVSDQVKAGLWWKDDGDEIYNKAIKDSQDAIKDSESLRKVKEKELAYAAKLAINENEKEYIRMKITGTDKLGGTISKEDLIYSVKKDMDLGKVEPEFADAYINALKSPKAIGAKPIDKDFANIIAEINKGSKGMKPQAIRIAMLELVSNGNISEKDFESATAYLDMMTDKNVDDLVTSGRRSAMDSIKNFAGANNSAEEESRARMSRSFISKIQSGTDPTEAALEAQREEVLFLRPEARSYPEGMLFIDNDGRQKKIMPNGDLVPAETKTKEKK